MSQVIDPEIARLGADLADVAELIDKLETALWRLGCEDHAAAHIAGLRDVLKVAWDNR